MKKLLFIVSLGLIAGIGHAAPQAKFTVPLSENRIMDAGLRNAGVQVSYLVTSTTPALVTDSDGNTVSDGFVHWVLVPATGTINSVYLELRSTHTANVSSARLVPVIAPLANGAALQAAPIIVFDPPIPFSGGLSVNLRPAGSAPASLVEYAVGVRWKRQ